MWSICTSVDAKRAVDCPSCLDDLATLGVMRYRHTLVVNKCLCVCLKSLLSLRERMSRVW